MSASRWPRTLPSLALAALLASAATASASPAFGVRAGVNLDRDDPLVGAELIAPMQSHWWANPNVEITFGDVVDVVGLNGDFHYDFTGTGSAYVWVGPGLAVLFRDFDRGGSDTDIGLNLMFGIGFRTASGAVPYVQAKATIADDTDGFLAFGVRF